jgi:putative lipase involved disintegration of autophagic bodies
MFTILPTALRVLLTAFLWGEVHESGNAPGLQFNLRHSHAIAVNDSRVIFADVPESFSPESYTVDIRHIQTHRVPSFKLFNAARSRSMRFAESHALPWESKYVPGPDVTKRATLLTLAEMAYNAYFQQTHKDWHDLGPEWNANAVSS